ncbi:hypothetical protein GGR54DRAFT_170552 [Hypoxylon sp. NC1633]|nr:hypothetical protein GGR54DRAFT_170552 [Hypoxylon sp. NC1633]
MDDPWNWDVDRVVQELCSADRSWEPPSTQTPLKFPPFEKLESALREQEVDGHTLITYDIAELCSGLGINILRHKAILKHAIGQFRARSQQYRLHKKREFDAFHSEQAGAPVGVKGEKITSQSDLIVLDPTKSEQDGTVPAASSPYLSGQSPPACESSKAGTPAKNKKQRIAPVLISTVINTRLPRVIPTEADVILANTADHTSAVHKDDTAGSVLAYIGKDAFTRIDIIDDIQSPEKGGLLPESRVGFFQCSHASPGRQLQVNQLYKRRLLRDGHLEDKRLFVPPSAKADMVSGYNNPDHDKILPVYGESDEEYDTETWDEIEAEQMDRAKVGGRTGLNREEILETISNVIRDMALDWEKRKLPKLLGKAHQIWSNARRAGLKRSIDKNRRDLDAYNSRIAKYEKELMIQSWSSIAELKETAMILQQTVQDREYHSWILGVITTASEPEKGPSVLRGSVRRPPRPRIISADDDELLTSESEGELDDFIIDDVPPSSPAGMDWSPTNGENDELPNTQEQPAVGDHLDEDLMDAEPTEMIDLTQLDGGENEDGGEGVESTGPRTPTKSQEHNLIDLVTPGNRPSKGSGSASGTNGEMPVYTPGIASTLIMKIDDLNEDEQKVALDLERYERDFLDMFFTKTTAVDPDQLWYSLTRRLLRGDRYPEVPHNTYEKRRALVAFAHSRLFEMYLQGYSSPMRSYKKLTPERRVLLAQSPPEAWRIYVNFLVRLSDRFDWRRLPDHSDSEEDEQEKNDSSPTYENTKKTRIRNQEARALRELDQERVKQQADRRKTLRAKIAQAEASGATMDIVNQKMIINESKEDEQGLVYIHPEIAPRIKQHQVKGVRFMWDQIVASETKQGCLLAHTMGLGKSMQIVTLFVAISEAAASSDPTISSQIADNLKRLQVLILCPPTLINNWLDELLIWTPEDHRLGEFYKVDQSTIPSERAKNIKSWNERGGVLIMGYHLFKNYFEARELQEALLKGPNLVIADEAHIIKNHKSNLHVATASIKTQSRIALTGSPMANNIVEYHSMINWVAPNYLSDRKEFDQLYALPIAKGVQRDSSHEARRLARKMLRVLKNEVAPKVQRITLAVLKHDIPTKQEFILTVPLTPLQHQVYQEVLRYQESNMASMLGATASLNFICGHPAIFMERLEDKSNKKAQYDAILTEHLISKEKSILRQERDLAADVLSWKVVLLVSILNECKRVGDSVLVFSQYTYTLNFLEQMLRKRMFSCERLDGQTPMHKRQDLVKGFNKGHVDVFLISTKAGGLGLNIVGANRVVIFDVSFNPQHEQQAVGRAYRIGQKKPVFVYRIICGNTCEEQVQGLAVFKTQLAARVVDKTNPVPKYNLSMPQWLNDYKEPIQKDIDTYIGKDEVLDKVIEKHRSGIRAITMSDTFEEEELENDFMTADDQREAEVLIALNQARRSGNPTAAPPTSFGSPSFPVGDGMKKFLLATRTKRRLMRVATTRVGRTKERETRQPPRVISPRPTLNISKLLFEGCHPIPRGHTGWTIRKRWRLLRSVGGPTRFPVARVPAYLPGL